MNTATDTLISDLKDFLAHTASDEDAWERYEDAKNWLLARSLSDADWERACRAAAEDLGL